MLTTLNCNFFFNPFFFINIICLILGAFLERYISSKYYRSVASNKIGHWPIDTNVYKHEYAVHVVNVLANLKNYILKNNLIRSYNYRGNWCTGKIVHLECNIMCFPIFFSFFLLLLYFSSLVDYE